MIKYKFYKNHITRIRSNKTEEHHVVIKRWNLNVGLKWKHNCQHRH